MIPATPTTAMQDVLRRMARAARTPLHKLTPSQARDAYAAGASVLEVEPAPLARVVELRIPARDGHAMPARLYAASHAHLPVAMYLHGGGFTVGSIDTHDTLCRELARLSGCAIVSVDYRLAPDHRFPQAHDDAWDALQWLTRSAPALGLDTSRLVVAGDSAGGTLAIHCAVLARDAGLPLRGQVLFYPGCSSHPESPSHQRYATGLVLDRELLEWFLAQYVDSTQRTDARFAPLLLDDVAELAPTWIGLAELDPLFDDGLAWADRLRAAAVPVQLEIYRGVTHEFIKMGRAIPEARQAHQHAAQAIQEALHP